MVNQQTLSGNWNSIKGEIRKKWSELTNDDLQAFNGNVEHLIGSIQTRTGEAREAIEQFLDEATNRGRQGVSQAAQGVSQAADVVRNYAAGAATQARQYVGDAIEAVEDGSQEAYEAVQQGYRQAENTIRSRPAEAAAVCFCAGILTGLMIAVTLRTR